MHYVRKDGTYYEGDRERDDDQLVPPRPDPLAVFDGWQWADPPVVVAQLQAAAINATRDQAINGGVEFEGHTYETDPRSLINLVSTVTAVNGGMALPQGFVWRTKDNVNVPMDADTVKRFLVTMVMTGFQIYAQSWTQKDALEIAINNEVVLN